MDLTTWITLFWLVAGIALIGSEVVAPTVVTLFLGAAAILVAALRYLGLVEGLPASVGIWMAASVVMVLGLRRFVVKYFPADREKGDVDEARAEFGREVEVLEDVREGSEDGRIRFSGTTWKATTTSGSIPKGARARIVFRDNLVYVVEPLELGALDAPRESSVPTATVDRDRARD